MKKIIKRIVIILIVFVIVFDFCYSNQVIAASQSAKLEKTLNAVTNLIGGIVSIVLWIPRVMMTGMAFVINRITDAIASSQRTNN